MSSSRGISDRGDVRTSITILVLGDEGVGKSSLISTFVSRHFSEMVPGLMTQVRLPPEPDSNCVTTIVDSQHGDKAIIMKKQQQGSESSLTSFTNPNVNKQQKQQPDQQQQQKQQQHHHHHNKKVDAIILVYDLDRVETFYRLENHWLPLIERYYDGEIPVIVAGNKWDLIRATPMTDEQSLVRSRQQLVSLLQRFRFVRQCIKCSAKNLLKVQDVFLKAQQAVLYPFAPLFDLTTGSLTKDCRKAFTRIFRMFDQDHDGLLSNAELDAFQYHTFRLPLVDRDLQGWKKVVSRSTDDPAVKDGKFTTAGFLAIFDVFISQNRLDVPWKVLRKFGYSNDLVLTIPSLDKKHSTTKLAKADRNFLAALFKQFDSSAKGQLSGDDLTDIFSIVPGPALPPWHPLRADTLLKDCFSLPVFGREDPPSPPSVTSSSNNNNPMELSVSASGITIASAASLPTVGDLHAPTISAPMSFFQWIGHWHMLAAISPAAARAELFRLGHVINTVDNSAAPRAQRRRKVVPPPVPSEELIIYVVGSQGCGKSSLLHLLCDMDPKETEPTTRPETSTTHKTFKRKKTEKEEANEEIMVHYIFTEVPRDTVQFAPLLTAKTRPLVLFCFDSEKSLFDAIEMEKDLLEEETARVFLLPKGTASFIEEAVAHCKVLDLEAPLVINTFDDSCRDDILDHLARCGLNYGSGGLKSKPHAEQKKREATRRRKMIWLGGLVSVSVAVAVGVGVLWGSKRKAMHTSRLGWLTELIFGRSASATAAATEA